MPISKSKSPSIRDLAREAGVSATTVSRVLNNSPIPSAGTRERVLAVARELDYRPDSVFSLAFRRQHRGERGQHVSTQTIGFFVAPHIFEQSATQDGYYSAVVTGAHEVLEKHAYHLLWAPVDGSATAIPQAVAEDRVDGLLVEGDIRRETLDLLIQRLPSVTVDSVYTDLQADAVVTDFCRAMQDQLQYLWDLGHRRIVTFNSTVARYFQRMSVSAFHDFFDRKGLPVPAPELSRPWDIDPETHKSVMRAYADALVAARPRPTALVASNIYALDLLELLQERGMRVPEEFSVAGLNDRISGERTRPAMTSYQVPMYEMGRAAAEMLLQRIEDPARTRRHLTVTGHRIERASCAPPPGENGR